jgi:hypothetical protein
MDVKKLFIELTKQLIPYKSEDLLLPYLPKEIEKDEVGNYRITIGDTRTMFTCHLDSYTDKLVPVNHKTLKNSKNQEIIITDGKTPLGADCKAGMLIMLNMIAHDVPGCYYFFIGEEAIGGGGCKGSRNILKATPDYFKQFDRCIAFDRHGYDSIISSQRGDVCCSDIFVKHLSSYFSMNKLFYKKDPTGRYTDSAVFMYIIPEVTNISTGGFSEHTNKEWQNLTFLENLCQATVNIPWEELPVERVPMKEVKKEKLKPTKQNKQGLDHKTYKGGGILSNLEDTVDGFFFGQDYVKRKREEEMNRDRIMKEYDRFIETDEFKKKSQKKENKINKRLKKFNKFDE